MSCLQLQQQDCIKYCDLLQGGHGAAKDKKTNLVSHLCLSHCAYP